MAFDNFPALKTSKLYNKTQVADKELAFLKLIDDKKLPLLINYKWASADSEKEYKQRLMHAGDKRRP